MICFALSSIPCWYSKQSTPIPVDHQHIGWPWEIRGFPSDNQPNYIWNTGFWKVRVSNTSLFKTQEPQNEWISHLCFVYSLNAAALFCRASPTLKQSELQFKCDVLGQTFLETQKCRKRKYLDLLKRSPKKIQHNIFLNSLYIYIDSPNGGFSIGKMEKQKHLETS